MKVVVGLGNPGNRYAKTRHNIGWMVLVRLADRAGWGGGRERDAARVVWGRFQGLDLELVKPQTFMNESGQAVRKVLAREHAPLEDLLVVADDFALPFGRLRLRQAGSAGGHNGLRSIIGELDSQKFARLRVGIGEPSRAAVDHVLSTFGPVELTELDRVIDAAADAVVDWARDGASRAANRWNAWQLHPPEPSSEPAGPDHGRSTQQPPALDGPAVAQPPAEDGGVGTDDIRRTRTGWRKLLPSPHEKADRGERR
ncbi:MAG: aminoacyl-tRNA hydrolase [Candidatus Limnocylindrales bacterium]